MPYTLIKAFERGIDTRKLIDTIEAGALLDARDCHVTLGGEIEKRAAFVLANTLPASTIGLWVTEGRVQHTWGTAATAPAGMPAGGIYHAVPHPDGEALTHILRVEEFGSQLYVIARYANGDRIHWWGTGTEPVTIPPIPPTPGGGTVPPTSTPANSPRASMYVQLMYYDFPPDIPITSIYLLPPTSTYNFGVDAWMIIEQAGTSGGWPYSDEVVSGATDPTPVAAKIADLVNSFLPPPVGGPPIKVEAQATGDTVKFWVSDMTGTYNGWRIKVTLGSIAIPQPNAGMITLSGGYVPPPDPDPPPPPEVPEVGDPLDMGTFVLAHNFRMWAVKDTLLNFSAPDNPGDWNDALTTGAGFIDMATITSRKPQLVSLADYRGDLAVFGRRHILIWHIDTLIESIYKRQTLHGTGTFAPHSVTPFGEGEVMYLDTSGIRSLRARDSSEAAYAADIGNMIDELVKAKVAASTEDQKYHNFWGVVEPRSGRLWMALYDKIFVLSYYPTSRIAAWTYYDATTRPVSMMNSSDDSIYWRSGNNVMVYGGTAGTTYDSTEALVRVPYIDGGKPATHKNWTGIDAAVYGTWAIRGSFDPMVPAALDLLATITKSTYAQQKIAVNGESPAVSLEFRTSFVGPAKLSNVSVHYTTSTED